MATKKPSRRTKKLAKGKNLEAVKPLTANEGIRTAKFSS